MLSSFRDNINLIISNRTHGSTYLLDKLIDEFITTELSSEELLWAFNELQVVDATMVLVHRFLRELKPAIGHDFRQHVLNYQRNWENVNIAITNNLLDYLADKQLTILTHSHSGVILDVLKNMALKGYMIDIIQSSSEPGGEGHIQAKAIEQLGINTTVIKDENIINSIDRVNCCFLGVDQYDKTSFVNKIGSKAIVKSADKYNVSVFVLGDSRKMVNSIEPITSRLFEIIPLISNVRLINEKTVNQ